MLKRADVMEGVFVNLAMKGTSTWVHIRQFTGVDEEGMVKIANGLKLTTTDFASLMFQLKAIEKSFLNGERRVEVLAANVETVHTTKSEHDKCDPTVIDLTVKCEPSTDHTVKCEPSGDYTLKCESVTNQTYTIHTGKRVATEMADGSRAGKRVATEMAEGSRAGTKGELRDRLKNRAKKQKMSKMSKMPKMSKSSYDEITMAFAQVLRQHIDGIVKSQCLGCMMNSMEYHGLFSNPINYVNLFFDDAMNVLEDEQIRAIIDEQRKVQPNLVACPSKSIVQADAVWREEVKQLVISLFMCTL